MDTRRGIHGKGGEGITLAERSGDPPLVLGFGSRRTRRETSPGGGTRPDGGGAIAHGADPCSCRRRGWNRREVARVRPQSPMDDKSAFVSTPLGRRCPLSVLRRSQTTPLVCTRTTKSSINVMTGHSITSEDLCNADGALRGGRSRNGGPPPRAAPVPPAAAGAEAPHLRAATPVRRPVPAAPRPPFR